MTEESPNEPERSKPSFFLNVVLPTIIFILVVIVKISYFDAEQSHSANGIPSPSWTIPQIMALLGGAGVFAAWLTIMINIVFGWRRDRREAQEHALKIEKLEFENRKLRREIGQEGEDGQ